MIAHRSSTEGRIPVRTADFHAIRFARWHLGQAKAYRKAWQLTIEAGDGAMAAGMIRGHMMHHAREALAEVRRTKTLHAQPDSEIGICVPAARRATVLL